MNDLPLPHLQDPGDHKKAKQYDCVDFKVRVGTSLVRSGLESQTTLIQREFDEEEKLAGNLTQSSSKDISRRTTPSSSRRSSIEIGNGSGLTGLSGNRKSIKFSRRRRDYGTFLRRMNTKPEIVYEGHMNPKEVCAYRCAVGDIVRDYAG